MRDPEINAFFNGNYIKIKVDEYLAVRYQLTTFIYRFLINISFQFARGGAYPTEYEELNILYLSEIFTEIRARRVSKNGFGTLVTKWGLFGKRIDTTDLLIVIQQL